MTGNNRILEISDNYPEKIDDRVPHLYRYMNFSSFMGILETESLTFHSIELFNDRYEGFIFETLLKELLDPKKDIDQFLFKVIRELSTRLVFANCWYQDYIESASMWDRYAKNDGIAIRTTYNRLNDCIKNGKIDYSFTPAYKPDPDSPGYTPNPFSSVIVVPVQYVYHDKNHTIKIWDHFTADWVQSSVTTFDKLKSVRDHLKDKSFGAGDMPSNSYLEYFSQIHRDCYTFKRRDFESEKEVRAITCYNLNLMALFSENKGFESKKTQNHFLGGLFRSWPVFSPVIRLTIDVKSLIEKIIICPTAFGTFTETVKSIIAKSELDVEVAESSLKKDDGIWFR